MSEVFRVVKKANGNSIRAYKKIDGEIGAEMEKADYIKELAEEFGSPTFVMTKKQLLERLQSAADRVQAKMQHSTISVAALKVYPIE